MRCRGLEKRKGGWCCSVLVEGSCNHILLPRRMINLEAGPSKSTENRIKYNVVRFKTVKEEK